ncbi:hypothetical protein PAL_GLEAN10012426 [Pteropus alecto]|uniref:Uncharacterized protein n=1 Tax=Pteropus alecto TaxID=9402 RepID=L5K6P2_PTEAL|nr:hypothetical protein PAL_GLEAN10012426 [Pteropus alecto]
MGAEERRGEGGPGGKPGRGARPFSRLSAYSSLRRLSFPSEPCGRRSSSRGGAGAGWSEEPGSPSSRGVALPLVLRNLSELLHHELWVLFMDEDCHEMTVLTTAKQKERCLCFHKLGSYFGNIAL